MLERVDFSRRRPDGRGDRGAVSAEQSAPGHRHRVARPAVGRAGRRHLHPARSARRTAGASRDLRRRPTASTSSASSCRSPAETARPDEVLTADIARLFADHARARAPASTGTRPGLASPALATHLRGYLTGSLDLVLRTRDGSGIPRFLVVDYKTNWLAPDGEALSAWHYRPDALAAEMQRDHYPLQASCTWWPCTAICAGGCRATTPRSTWAACCTCSSAA